MPPFDSSLIWFIAVTGLIAAGALLWNELFQIEKVVAIAPDGCKIDAGDIREALRRHGVTTRNVFVWDTSVTVHVPAQHASLTEAVLEHHGLRITVDAKFDTSRLPQ